MDYTQEINSAPVVLVEFYATWCPHCQRMMPIVEDVKKTLGDKLKVIQLDIDKNEELSDKEKVDVIPTFILYDSGKEVMRQSGEMSADELLSKIQPVINK